MNEQQCEATHDENQCSLQDGHRGMHYVSPVDGYFFIVATPQQIKDGAE